LDNPWGVPKPPVWQPVLPPIKHFEYSSGYDILSIITTKYHSATVLLPTSLQKELESALHILCMEDPSLRVEMNKESGQTLLHGLGTMIL